ncbi:MAG: hypothetical protein L0Y66_08420 [Myxococcaceae bacterium]|nr:hypothetical protein [Myxococcaceae bacterium]MCI0670898.1 hypothetical protein [Myxococcaceae bacterium]
MRRFVAAVSTLFLPFVAGCPSATSLCRSGVDQVCERSFECQPQAVKDSPQFQAGFGRSVEECKELLYANPLRPQNATGIACAAADSDQDLCANLGQPDRTNFDLGKASECRDARADLACADYLAQLTNPAMAPAACAERCTE